ncbi:hypothetical protein OI18_20150 [Flavihumibacter solisilvae]|uniref:Uncharacterized protein n=2 Tax=Flavihumibacter solisilvae TaxID=1349421 RepID=A0A0C1IR16_9BACT|nr:hypothetical protein OI18_20150 [Flavihumibacter solisilvae]
MLSSCENKKESIVNRQQAIKEEMEQVRASYFKTTDSLESVKATDTSSAKHHEIAEKLVSAEKNKNVVLIPLQKEFDSLDVELKKY